MSACVDGRELERLREDEIVRKHVYVCDANVLWRQQTQKKTTKIHVCVCVFIAYTQKIQRKMSRFLRFFSRF